MAELPDIFNPRHASYTVQSHRSSHRTSTETARKDLSGLEDLGLLRKLKTGKRYVFVAVPNIADRVAELSKTEIGSQRIGGAKVALR
jgi:hypothetical protein